MRRELLSLLLSASLFGAAAHGQEEPDPKALLRDLKSPDRQVRLQAAEDAGIAAYGINDPALLAQFRQLLFAILAQEGDPAARARVAATLQSYLSLEGTPTADFLKAEPYLVDSNEAVREVLWMGFSQQASQGSLNAEIDARLLALVGHSDRQIRLEALNWAINASQMRDTVVGQPLSALGKQTLALCQELSDNADPVISNLAIYGLLSKFEHAPQAGMAVMAKHLDDPYGSTRSLVLDFITQNGLSKPELATLAPALLERFRARPAGGDFPMQADAELGPAALPPQSEVFRLALALAVVGPLPEDVWSYLLGEAAETESDEMLLQIAQLKGEAGRPLAGKILQDKPPSDWLPWANAFVDTGLPSSYLGPIVEELNKRPFEFAEEDFDGPYGTRSLLLILARSGAPSSETIAAPSRQLASQAPMVRAAAIYALAVLDPQGPAGQAAVKTLMESDWSRLYTGTELLTAAAWRLRDSGLKASPTLVVDDRVQSPLLAWVLGQPDASAEPAAFLEMYETARQSGRAEGGTGSDLVLIELGWLADHPQPSARPGLERLSQHEDPQIQAAARKALSALGEKT